MDERDSKCQQAVRTKPFWTHIPWMLRFIVPVRVYSNMYIAHACWVLGMRHKTKTCYCIFTITRHNWEEYYVMLRYQKKLRNICTVGSSIIHNNVDDTLCNLGIWIQPAWKHRKNSMNLSSTGKHNDTHWKFILLHTKLECFNRNNSNDTRRWYGLCVPSTRLWICYTHMNSGQS